MEKIKSLLNDFELTDILPELDGMAEKCALVARFGVLIAPAVLLFLGLWYLILPPKEANHYVGFRCFRGMGSVDAWRFTQKLAGIVWIVTGAATGIFAWLTAGGFAEMALEDALFSAVKTIGWELAATVASIILIRIVLLVRFNLKGQRRGKAASAEE